MLYGYSPGIICFVTCTCMFTNPMVNPNPQSSDTPGIVSHRDTNAPHRSGNDSVPFQIESRPAFHFHANTARRVKWLSFPQVSEIHRYARRENQRMHDNLRFLLPAHNPGSRKPGKKETTSLTGSHHTAIPLWITRQFVEIDAHRVCPTFSNRPDHFLRLPGRFDTHRSTNHKAHKDSNGSAAFAFSIPSIDPDVSSDNPSVETPCLVWISNVMPPRRRDQLLRECSLDLLTIQL